MHPIARFGKKRSSQLPEGWIKRGDQVMIPVDEVTPEFAEGEHTFRILDEWEGDAGSFVGVNATAVREEAETSDDPRAAALEAMGDPANWVDESVAEGVEIAVCRVDMDTGKLAIGPAMAEVLMGTADFEVMENEGRPCICVNSPRVKDEVFRQIEARDYEVTEDEHRALTFEVMDDPANWMREGEMDSDPDDEEPKWMLYPFDRTTGRIDRR